MLTAKQILTMTIVFWLFSSAPGTATDGAANSANNGLAVTGNDGAVYYLDLTGDIYANAKENIYRLSANTTAPSIICTDEAWNLTISGKYLYYSNWSDNHNLYRLNLDSGEKTQLTNQPVSQLAIAYNWLVYFSAGNTDSARGIYKLSTDGPQLPQLLVNDQAENLIVANNWIYYLNPADNYRIYKINFDGTGRCKLADDPVIFMAIANDTIYYSNAADNSRLYTLQVDGHHRSKLTDDSVGFINADKDYIYYTNAAAKHALYRMNIKNHNQQLVCAPSLEPQPILLVRDQIYYDRLFFKR